MNDLEIFQQLKIRILETYREHYPYFHGDWKDFSSKDIRQLTELIENELKERVSEKWIYTHLKPSVNEKLPRKDMLDIFSKFTGYSGWDEFLFKNRESEPKADTIENDRKRTVGKYWLLFLLLPFIGMAFYFLTKEKKTLKTIQIQNEITKEPVTEDEIEIYKVTETGEVPIESNQSKIEIEESDEKIIIESPFFERKEINPKEVEETISLKPEDYALVLKNYMLSDLKEWEDRKEKLDKILSDDLEVIIYLKENLGAEYLNKEEFSNKLVIPTSETAKMKILNVETNENKEITYIRIMQQ